MSNLYAKYKTSDDAEKDGVPIEYGDGVVLTLRRAGGRNTKYRDSFDEHTKKNKRRISVGDLPEDEARMLFAKVYADSVVVGWSGVKGADNQALEFNKENVVQVLYDLPEFFALVQQDALSYTHFRNDTLEDDAGN